MISIPPENQCQGRQGTENESSEQDRRGQVTGVWSQVCTGTSEYSGLDSECPKNVSGCLTFRIRALQTANVGGRKVQGGQGLSWSWYKVRKEGRPKPTWMLLGDLAMNPCCAQMPPLPSCPSGPRLTHW